MDADIRELFEKYAVLAGLLLSLLMVGVAALLWVGDNKPIAGLLFVLALIWPLSVLAVALDGLDALAEDEDPRRRG